MTKHKKYGKPDKQEMDKVEKFVRPENINWDACTCIYTAPYVCGFCRKKEKEIRGE